MLKTYTKESPCRCGNTGDGAHRCHGGRDPGYPGSRCEKPAKEIEIMRCYPTALAGQQFKLGVQVAYAYYCDECMVEAGFDPTKAQVLP